jgi:hypothetical protein
MVKIDIFKKYLCWMQLLLIGIDLNKKSAEMRIFKNKLVGIFFGFIGV